MKKINTKKYFSSLIILFMFIFSAMPAQADLADMSASSAALEGMNSIFSDLGVNKDELKYSIQTMNVSRQKQTPPQVTLEFTPQNPQEGDQLAVTATPLYFMNDTSKLYFTWFLQQKDCDRTDNPDSEERRKCDMNKDRRVDIEDYKIKAMRVIAGNDFSWESADYSHSDGKSEHNAIFGGTDQQGKAAYCHIQDIKSGNVYPIGCNSHLFPDAPHAKTGDNSFGREEEQFWHTDPTSADTGQSGNADEANVAGLGMNKFTWNYTLGDKIGVVVEGASIEPSQTGDSSYRTMWAAPKGMCHKKSIAEGTFIDVSSLNECLYDNLVAPAENSPESDKLEVNLSFSPTSPINDPTSYSDSALSNGDELTVQSSINNANDNNYLQYSWEVFASDEPNPELWGSPLPKASLPNVTQMEGLGITSLKFKLNLARPKKYLNVKLTVKENTRSEFSREGHSSVLIPIASNNDLIDVFATSTSNAAAPRVSLTEKMCTSGTENAVCPVAKNKIIGLKIDSASLTDFLWTIDGAPFTYKECFFDGCNINKQTNTAYFPALRGVGENYTVNLTAINQETGEKVNLSRTFQVVDPAATIVSADESVCKPVLLGNYVDISGKEWPDYSKANFWGLADHPIALKAEINGFSPTSDTLAWIVNGQELTAANASTLGHTISASGVLTLAAKSFGESYEVSVRTLYTQDIATKTALNKYWDVSYEQFYEKNVSSAITIHLQDSTVTVAAAQSEKIMATIYSGTPAYLAFLLKIVLTAFLLLFSSQLILAFFPKINRIN